MTLGPTRPPSADGRSSRPDPGPLVCVGQFAGAHGVRGQVKLRSFTTDPLAILEYGPLLAADGRQFRVTLKVERPEDLLVAVAGIADRDAAQALAGLALHVPRALLPEPEDDSFYHADLIGLAVVLADGSQFGTVRAVHEFGAGDVLEVAPADNRPTVMFPFTLAVVPAVDIAAGWLRLDPPEGWDRPPDPDAPDGGPSGDGGPGERARAA